MLLNPRIKNSIDAPRLVTFCTINRIDEVIQRRSKYLNYLYFDETYYDKSMFLNNT